MSIREKLGAIDTQTLIKDINKCHSIYIRDEEVKDLTYDEIVALIRTKIQLNENKLNNEIKDINIVRSPKEFADIIYYELNKGEINNNVLC